MNTFRKICRDLASINMLDYTNTHIAIDYSLECRKSITMQGKLV